MRRGDPLPASHLPLLVAIVIGVSAVIALVLAIISPPAS
jgi:uncharacterized membrane protein YidH (DUF202 family)